MLWGPAASEISEQRGQGALKGLGSHADFKPKIVYEAHADFNRQKAYDETERALAAYDFDAVIGLNSYMAVSAKNAVQSAGKLADIVIVGMGGTIDELHIIAGVVLGGTALYGGVGTVVGTVLGIMTIGVLENGMVLVGADFHVQRVLIGVLLISAVAYQGYRRRRQAAIPTS